MKISVSSMKRREVESDCHLWAQEITKTYKPDLVVFVADSGFIVAKAVAEELDLPLKYVKAVRSGNKAKDKTNSFSKYIPQKLVEIIISSPLKFYLHKKKKERNVEIPDSLVRTINGGKTRILLVDDAVDTGWTIKQVVESLNNEFANIEIRTAAYSVAEYSLDVVKIDYYRFWNNLVLTATSRKSAEYVQFKDDLAAWFSERKDS